MLEEGAAFGRKAGLSLDPACFVPALRACCASDGGEGEYDDDGREREDGSGAESGAALLGKMETLAGVPPDVWCANVVMEVGGERKDSCGEQHDKYSGEVAKIE